MSSETTQLPVPARLSISLSLTREREREREDDAAPFINLSLSTPMPLPVTGGVMRRRIDWPGQIQVYTLHTGKSACGPDDGKIT